MTLLFSTVINGKPNYFIEKIWRSLQGKGSLRDAGFLSFNKEYRNRFGTAMPMRPWGENGIVTPPKLHTIRRDEKNRWGAGCDIHFVINNRTSDRFQFAPVIKCVSVQEIKIIAISPFDGTNFKRTNFILIDDIVLAPSEMDKLAINDGFDCVEDFFAYFNKDFTGKIIHWTDLKY
jgi:hypothetical protein